MNCSLFARKRTYPARLADYMCDHHTYFLYRVASLIRKRPPHRKRTPAHRPLRLRSSTRSGNEHYYTIWQWKLMHDLVILEIWKHLYNNFHCQILKGEKTPHVFVLYLYHYCYMYDIMSTISGWGHTSSPALASEVVNQIWQWTLPHNLAMDITTQFGLTRNFHGQILKEETKSPDWATPARPPWHPKWSTRAPPRETQPEVGSYLRLIASCITQLKAQGPPRACNESKEEEEEDSTLDQV